MKQQILVIDDELGPREAFRMLLKDRFDLCMAASGPEGLARVAERDFDLVLLDLRMPGMDGIEVLRELRALRPTLPVVVVTAFATVETAEEAIAMGAFASLIKPFNRRDVERVIERALNPAP
ncbi:MAG: response regulator [Armatimonadetes bacterium]|jgi:DNA-binding NtrC family response regulator|nr:response regulator [Armatimonadota bacterium]